MQPHSIQSLIAALVTEGVEFVVIGGMAGVLHGAPVVTKDLDIVHRRTPENVARLLVLLRSIDARLRADSRRIQPTESMLTGRGNVRLDTSSGPLDVLGELGEGEDYEWLLRRSEIMPLDELPLPRPCCRRQRRVANARDQRRQQPELRAAQRLADAARDQLCIARRIDGGAALAAVTPVGRRGTRPAR